MTKSPHYDIIIIGAGPIGMACAIEAKKANLNYLIIEKGALVNSLFNYPVFMTFFSTSQKLEIGGVPFVTINPKPNRNEAVEYYRRVAEKFDLKINLFETVKQIVKQNDIFEISFRLIYLPDKENIQDIVGENNLIDRFRIK